MSNGTETIKVIIGNEIYTAQKMPPRVSDPFAAASAERTQRLDNFRAEISMCVSARFPHVGTMNLEELARFVCGELASVAALRAEVAVAAKPAEPSGNAELTAEEVGRIWDEVMKRWLRWSTMDNADHSALTRFARNCRRGMVTEDRLGEVKREVIQWSERAEKAEARVRKLEMSETSANEALGEHRKAIRELFGLSPKDSDLTWRDWLIESVRILRSELAIEREKIALFDDCVAMVEEPGLETSDRDGAALVKARLGRVRELEELLRVTTAASDYLESSSKTLDGQRVAAEKRSGELMGQLTAANTTIEELRRGVGDEVTEEGAERLVLAAQALVSKIPHRSASEYMKHQNRELIRLARVNHRPKLREVTDEECESLLKATSRRMFAHVDKSHVFADAMVIDPPKFARAILKLATGDAQ